MRDKILKILREHQDEYVSGEMICQACGVSRTAVWKHMRELEERGYQIDAVRNRGYRLLYSPDVVTPEEIILGLKTDVLGREIVYRDQVESTNALATELAYQGASEGTLVVADQQTGGRGRRGRAWFSPPGKGVWMSLILRPKLSPAYASQLTLVAAIALSRAFSSLTGQQAGIKWPNDILFGSRKCCGILTEMHADHDRIHHIVLGIGINVNMESSEFPEELRDIAVSLRIVKGEPLERSKVIQSVLTCLEPLYLQYVREGGFSSLREEWKRESITIGRNVRAVTPRGEFEGTAVDIDEAGALCLKTKNGEIIRIHSAEILFN
jgi:BirA family transcriptional regulator, biotin operon repressor / biotin---[acetyl-CoA-carboxylase] ligase